MIQRGQRSYSYLESKPSSELGHMKRRARPAGPLQDELIPCSNTTSFDLLNNPNRQQFARRVAERYVCSKTTLPQEDKENKRPESIKIVSREPSTGYSGVYYLIHKSGGRGSGHAERKHVIENHYQNKTDHGRRHFDITEMSRTAEIQKPHESIAMTTKVTNDLMSSIPDNQYHRRERPSTSKQRQSLNTMLRTSYEAGYENHPKPTISLQKRIEIAGNGLDKEPMALKARRDDYRRSSIVFG